MKSISISRIVLGVVAALLLSSACSSVCSAEVLKIVVNDTIQPITEEYIARAIDEAQRRIVTATIRGAEAEWTTAGPGEAEGVLEEDEA